MAKIEIDNAKFTIYTTDGDKTIPFTGEVSVVQEEKDNEVVYDLKEMPLNVAIKLPWKWDFVKIVAALFIRGLWIWALFWLYPESEFLFGVLLVFTLQALVMDILCFDIRDWRKYLGQ